MKRKPPASCRARWTIERDAYLKDGYPANIPMHELLRALNAMPGLPIGAVQVQDRAVKSLRVYRPGPKPTPPRTIVLENAPVLDEPLRPLARRTRDGVVSVAWLDAPLQRDDTVPVSIGDVRLWASQHARDALDSDDLVTATNEARIRFGLPPFRLVKLRQPALPPAWFGSDSRHPTKEKSPVGDIGD